MIRKISDNYANNYSRDLIAIESVYVCMSETFRENFVIRFDNVKVLLLLILVFINDSNILLIILFINYINIYYYNSYLRNINNYFRYKIIFNFVRIK